MAWAPDYCTAAELKALLRITDTNDDTELGYAITAASRLVDRFCDRQFGSVSPAAARYYTWDRLEIEGYRAVEIDDLQSTTGLVVVSDEDGNGTWEATLTLDTDFKLYPWNAAADGKPWTHLVSINGSTHVVPSYPRALKVTALWGWTSVPTVVKQATLLQASRIWHRRLAPFGIAGSPTDGSEMRLLARVDPDVQIMLKSVQRQWGAR